MAKKNYSEEFRRDAVELYRDTGGATVAGIAADLGVSHGSLTTWLRNAGIPIRRPAATAPGPEVDRKHVLGGQDNALPRIGGTRGIRDANVREPRIEEEVRARGHNAGKDRRAADAPGDRVRAEETCVLAPERFFDHCHDPTLAHARPKVNETN